MNKRKTISTTESYIPKLIRPPISYNKIFEKARVKDASLSFRHAMIQANKRQNYINEYDRLKGILTSDISHGSHDHVRLQERQKDLKQLFADSFKTNTYPLHDIYKKV